MRMFFIEGLGTVLILFLTGWLAWRVVLSKLSIIRAALKKKQLQEIQDVAKTAREFNPEQVNHRRDEPGGL